MRALWDDAKLDDVAVQRIDVQLDYADFDDFWHANAVSSNTVSKAIENLSSTEVAQLKAQLRVRLATDPHGRISYGAFANAVKGRVS